MVKQQCRKPSEWLPQPRTSIASELTDNTIKCKIKPQGNAIITISIQNHNKHPVWFLRNQKAGKTAQLTLAQE